MREKVIMLADDNLAFLNMMEAVMRDWSPQSEIVRAVNGIEARDKLVEKGSPYDIILLDFDMPGINGLELARFIKRETEKGCSFATKESFVAVISGSVDYDCLMPEVKKLGFHFLAKPFRLEELYRFLPP